MIHTIPFSRSLLEVLVPFIFKETGGDIEELMKTTVILPTHRACQQLKETFFSIQGKATVLPRIISLTADMNFLGSVKPIPPYNRLFSLSRMARALVKNPDRALKIALSLSHLLDEIYQYEVDFSHLSDLVDQNFAEHWNETLRFLDIIKTSWPAILKENNFLDQKDYEIKQLHARAALWEKDPPQNLLIIAGFDHTLPAVAHLCQAIHHAPKGHIFLQGVDTTLSLNDLKALPTEHHQSIFSNLFSYLNLNPKEVQSNFSPSAIEQFLSKKLAQEKTDSVPCQHISYIQAQNPEEEALSCALILRKVLETPNKRAVLVTNDRMLSRRVISHMKRFQVILDDSAGIPFTKTTLGIYLMLLADYATDPSDHKTLVSLLKNPFVADGRGHDEVLQEIMIAEKTARENQKKLIYGLKTDLSPFLNLYTQEKVSFKQMFALHIQTALELARSADATGTENLWGTDAGQMLYQSVQDIYEHADIFGEIEPAFYPEIFKILLQEITFRNSKALHPRLDILGPIEARFVQADTFILAGLNEGSWPSRAETGVWLNRAMRSQLGLPQPEEQNTIETRDFLSFLCKKEVFLTRSMKVGGTPMLSSRYFSLLEDVLSPQVPHLTRKLLTPSKITPCPRPMPYLKDNLKPHKLSVTQIRYLMRNPYVIYVQKVLKLKELPELENLSKNQIYGTTVHEVLEQYLKDKHPPSLWRLLRMGYHVLRRNGFSSIDLKFYFPRFARVAFWFIEQELKSLPTLKKSYLETYGSWQVPLDKEHFELTCIADRLDVYTDGIEIIDYKTGQVPNKNSVKLGLEPQLPLEALMLKAGAFSGISVQTVKALSYWQLKGKDGGNNLNTIATADKDLSDLLSTTQQGFIDLITTYLTQNIPFGVYGFDDNTSSPVAPLERVQEWQYTLETDQGEAHD